MYPTTAKGDGKSMGISGLCNARALLPHEAAAGIYPERGKKKTEGG